MSVLHTKNDTIKSIPGRFYMITLERALMRSWGNIFSKSSLFHNIKKLNEPTVMQTLFWFHEQIISQLYNKYKSNISFYLNKLTRHKELISMNLLQFTPLQGTLQVFCYYRNMYKQTELFFFSCTVFSALLKRPCNFKAKRENEIT